MMKCGKVWATAVIATFVLTLTHAAAADDDRCRDRPPAVATGPGIVSATVRNAITGQPAVGAVVEWSFDGHAMTGSTDKQGRFALRLPVANHEHGERVKVTLKGNGYAPRASTVTVCPGQNEPLAFRLSPTRRLGIVKGAVVDPATGQGIANATVAILIDNFPQIGLSATTDSDGAYAIRNVGFGNGLTLQVTTAVPPCVAPTTLNLDVDEPVVTKNLRLPVVPTPNLHCPSVFSGPSGPAGGGSLADDSSIQWQIATADAILFDEDTNVWHSGHINDILKAGPNNALVASDSGGVWSVGWSSETAAAIPLSTGWDSISITSLAQGPDGPDHVYAGTFGSVGGDKGGMLWETDTSSAAPLFNWAEHTTTPCANNNINHILVIREFRRVVLACSNGIFWSPIPPAPAAQGAYNWQPAQAAPGTLLPGNGIRLAKGPGWSSVTGGQPTEGIIVAIAWGGTAPLDLIYRGGWLNGQLVLNSSVVPAGPGNLFQTFGRGHLAACPLDHHTMYAMAADGATNTVLAGVWRSSDGGQNWAAVDLPPNGTPPIATGGQGWYNQALAVSPADCNTFALGWSYATFVSFDGGNSYPMVLHHGMSGEHLHDDYHALLFDPFDPQTLWLGSDGGLASASGIVRDGSPRFASYYNQHLPDLQFYHVAPSYNAANLVAGSLQDNAVVWSVLPNWWTTVPDAGGDGSYVEFVGVGPSGGGGGFGGGGAAGSTDILAWSGDLPGVPSGARTWQWSVWDGGFSTNPPNIPVADNGNPRDPAGIRGTVSYNVRSPSYANVAGELMYVVAGNGQSVYGLFANSDGSDLHWESIGSISAAENVSAISSYNGNVVFVGTDRGNICQLTQPYSNPGGGGGFGGGGPCVYFTISQPAGGAVRYISQLLEFFPTIGMAATNSSVLTLTGQSWQVSNGGLPLNLPFLTLDGPDLGSVFVANTNQVFVTHDFGATWMIASDQLPSVPHTSELHYVREPNSKEYMYLATYGWSMFRAPLN